jgi:transmembrane sensor
MIMDRFWNLLAKKNFAEANDAELRELETILLAHPELQDTADIITILSHQSNNFPENLSAGRAFDALIERMKKADIDFEVAFPAQLNTEPKPRRRAIWLFSFLAVAVVFSLSFFIVRNDIGSAERRPAKKSTLSQVTTKPGSKSQIQLPDGSSVWLNSSSSLTYDKNFGKSIREVNLVGEAFFDVAKDSSHPFIIHTAVVDVRVLGTAFNVMAYPNDANTVTSIIRGKVEVTVKNRANEKVYLEPNEKLVVANNVSVPSAVIRSLPKKDIQPKSLFSVQHLTYYPADSTIIETSWVDNRLMFQSDETFYEVALKMERWYGVHISFADEKVAAYHPFGSFTNETITQALDALRLGLKFNYKIDGNNILITQ